MTRPGKNPVASRIRTRDLPLSRRTPKPLGQRGGPLSVRQRTQLQSRSVPEMQRASCWDVKPLRLKPLSTNTAILAPIFYLRTMRYSPRSYRKNLSAIYPRNISYVGFMNICPNLTPKAFHRSLHRNESNAGLTSKSSPLGHLQQTREARSAPAFPSVTCPGLRHKPLQRDSYTRIQVTVRVQNPQPHTFKHARSRTNPDHDQVPVLLSWCNGSTTTPGHNVDTSSERLGDVREGKKKRRETQTARLGPSVA